MSKRFAIIGAGAAGCLCAIEIKRRCPDAVIDLYEGGSRPLAKVAVTGGGRCNLTNDFEGIRSLAEAYPRGEKLMKRLFHRFNHEDTIRWFEQEGVRFVTQEDHCVFPVTQDAMTIVRTLTRLIDREGIRLHLRHKVYHIEKSGTAGYRLSFSDAALPPQETEVLIVTAGGFPKVGQFGMFDGLGLEIVEPVPSLFALNIEEKALKELAGALVSPAVLGIAGTRFKSEGVLLLTDFGLSGPATLKLSSYAARYLKENDYRCMLTINWLGEMSGDQVRAMLQEMQEAHPMKLLASIHPEPLSSRLWKVLLQRAGLSDDLRWSSMGKKQFNRLVETLTNDQLAVTGKNRFKEEFVTCGGIALSNLDLNTLESKTCPGLYFAGEVMDVDAITGGFNLQAAWTTGFVVAESCTR